MTDIQEHLVKARTCVVAFASGGGDFGGDLTHFEFARTLERIGCARVLMRDSTERWYLDGVQGVGDRAAVATYVKCLSEVYDRVIAVGVSSGAYGALMYGRLGFVDEVIAISPVTGTGPTLVDDPRVPPHLLHRVQVPDDFRMNLNLKPIFDAAMNAWPTLTGYISDGDGTELDQLMFERLLDGRPIHHVGQPGGGWVRSYHMSPHTLTMIPGFAHKDVGKALRDRGMFDRLFA